MLEVSREKQAPHALRVPVLEVFELGVRADDSHRVRSRSVRKAMKPSTPVEARRVALALPVFRRRQNDRVERLCDKEKEARAALRH